jgi:amino acid adenylation domain-containing protein
VSSPDLLHHLLFRAADAAPDSIAVIDGDRHVTYGELASQARDLASLLSDLGAGPGDRVGVAMTKSADAVAAIYGVLASGAAYVPLDPDAPAARSAAVLRDCGVHRVVSDDAKVADIPAMRAAGAPIDTLVVPTAGTTDDVDALPGVRVLARDAVQGATAEPRDANADDLAYVLYTSGSTGTPKGISLTHTNALAFVNWAVEEFAVGPDDRLSSHAPFHFDLSIFDLYAATHAGARVVLVPRAASVFPREVQRFIDGEQITIWYSVPWVLVQLVQRAKLSPGTLPTLRTLLFAGEVFPVRPLGELMDLLPHVRFANLYGPTECNVCTWFEVVPVTDTDNPIGDIPIGRAITGVDLLVVVDGRIAGTGDVGELYVHGPTVMQGYWGDRERTDAALVAHPLGLDAPAPWLRTGDLVEVLADGNLRFRGRRDEQVKHRGFRIELGDVEAALSAHPKIAECAVVLEADERAGTRLVAHVVGDGSVDASEVRQVAAQRLPRYMVPDDVVFIDTLPRTSTGKIDRRALGRANAPEHT